MDPVYIELALSLKEYNNKTFIMKNYFFIALISIMFLQACKKNDGQIPKPLESYSTKLDGKYKLLNIFTTVPVDLNRDGIFSTDLTIEVPFIKDTNKFYLQFSTTQYSIPYQIIDQWVPLANVFIDTKGNYLKTEYGFINLNSRYSYDESKNLIKIIPLSLGIISAELMEDNKIKITSEKTFYTTKGWEMLTLVATYKRR